jgi:hypothetical protein
MIKYKYAAKCGEISWKAPSEKGIYEFRLVQSKVVGNETKYFILVKSRFEIK